MLTAVSGSWKVHDTGTRFVSPEKVAPDSDSAGSPPGEGLAALLGSVPFLRRLGCLRLRLTAATQPREMAGTGGNRDELVSAGRQFAWPEATTCM